MRTLYLLAIAVALTLTVGAQRADAYPQFQLGRDGTCTGCHIAPQGGGTLNENGLATAQAIASDGNAPEFLHGALGEPSWLHLSGDVRAAAGFVYPGTASAAAYPMQAELGADAEWKGFSIHALGGFRRPADSGNALHVLWSREHYVMWQQNPGETTGLYVRVGRMMPTYGLRLAEHVAYTQKFGGDPLYFEAYAAAVSYIAKDFEVHATGFVHDTLDGGPEHGDGGALYAEVRLGEHAAVGAEAKYAASADQDRTYAGVTGKLYVPSADVTIDAEAEVIRQKILAGAGDANTQIAAYALASRPLGGGFLLDVGLGHYTQDTRVAGLYRDCLDANLHWFETSHTEWLVTTRLELLDHGAGPTGAYALLQIHYRF